MKLEEKHKEFVVKCYAQYGTQCLNNCRLYYRCSAICYQIHTYGNRFNLSIGVNLVR